MYEKHPFIEQTPTGWIYGWEYPKPWWKFWGKSRRSFYPAMSREEAEKRLQELQQLYVRLGCL